MRNKDSITRLLQGLGEEPGVATKRLIPLVYEELRRTAHRELGRHRPGDTLDTSALVHEAYLKLAGPDDRSWNDRAHFFAVAATAMRQIIVDHARQRRTEKHGGRLHRVSLDERRLMPDREAEELLALDEALERLAGLNARLSQVVECRFFAGLTVPETAAALGCSPRTVDRDWKKAKAWLYRELSGA
ncbi:MAG: ECF-type sigma factor [Gemmatimonadota bacterium]|jgi:RNA polymerase sigma factor (TIGR02999 family)